MPKGNTDYILLRMPEKLKAKIRSEAFRTKTDMTAVCNRILGEHFDVEVPQTSKRTAPFGGGRRAA